MSKKEDQVKTLEEENEKLKKALSGLVHTVGVLRAVIATERIFGKTEFDDVDEVLKEDLQISLEALKNEKGN